MIKSIKSFKFSLSFFAFVPDSDDANDFFFV